MRHVIGAALLVACARPPSPPSLDASLDAASDAAIDAVSEDRSDTNNLFEPRFEPWDTGSISPLCNGAGWCWESPSPAGGEVVSISASGDDEAWSLTADGMLIHAFGGRLEAMRGHPYDLTLGRGRVWSRGAALWVSLRDSLLRWNGAAFERARFYDGFNEPTLVWGSSPDDLWVGGPQGDALHFDGARWSHHPLAIGVNLAELTGFGREPWALNFEGNVARWRDGAWRELASLPMGARGLAVVGSDEAWACDEGVAFHWQGAAWRREVVDRAPVSQRCVVWSDGDSVWFSDGASVRRRDSDGAWSIESETRLVTAAESGIGGAWVGRGDGVIQRVMSGAWAGVTRTRPRFDVTRIVGDDDATLRAMTVATIMGFDGVAWFEATAPARYYELHGVAAAPAGDTWIAGLTRVGARDSGRASRWNRTDGERDVLEAPAPLRAIAERSSDDVWAVGDGGAAWHFDGATWTRVETGTTRDLRDVWAPLPDDVWAVGTRVALRWNGREWSSLTLPVEVELTRVHGRSTSDVWMIGWSPAASRAYVLRYDGAAVRVDTAGLPAGVRVEGVWAGADAVWLAGSTVLRRDARVWNAESMSADATMRAAWGTRDGAVRMGGSSTSIFVRRPR